MSEKTFETETQIPDDVLQWLKDRLRCLDYGEVGFTLVIVDGQVKRVRKIDEEQRRV